MPVILHSDRDIQFTSDEHQGVLAAHRITRCSFSQAEALQQENFLAQ
jgi:hypothetical protein